MSNHRPLHISWFGSVLISFCPLVLAGCPSSDSAPAQGGGGSGGQSSVPASAGGATAARGGTSGSGGLTESGGAQGSGGVTGTGGATLAGSTAGSSATDGGGTNPAGGKDGSPPGTGGMGIAGSVTGGAIGRGGVTSTTGTGAGGSTNTAGTGAGGVTSTAGTGAGGITSTAGTGAGGITVRGTGGGSGGIGGASGTGGVTGSGGGSGTAPSLQGLAAAFCSAARSCCALKAYPTAPLADCETQFQSRVRSLALVNKGTVVIDSSGLATCIAAYTKAATLCSFYDVVDGCGGVFVGTKPDGQLCGSGNQSGGLECDSNGGPKMCFWTQSPSDPSITGTCMPIPHGKQGDACVTTCYKGDDCSGDLYAWTGADTANCFETDGLYCKHEDNGVATCAPLLPHGATCSTAAYDACGSGNYCDWNDSTCKASATIGQSCQTIACLSRFQCGTDQKCANVPLANDEVCAGNPAVP
jgi:hypothetical protein